MNPESVKTLESDLQRTLEFKRSIEMKIVETRTELERLQGANKQMKNNLHKISRKIAAHKKPNS